MNTFLSCFSLSVDFIPITEEKDERIEVQYSLTRNSAFDVSTNIIQR